MAALVTTQTSRPNCRAWQGRDGILRLCQPQPPGRRTNGPSAAITCAYKGQSKGKASQKPQIWSDERLIKVPGSEPAVRVPLGNETFQQMKQDGYYLYQDQLHRFGDSSPIDMNLSEPNDNGDSSEATAALWRPIWSDRYMLVVEKDSGLLSAPGKTQPDCLISRITSKPEFQDARIVHRLDRDTSGIMVLGFGARNHRSLSIQFQDRKVFKVYQALVSGHIQGEQGTIDLPIGKNPDPVASPRMRIDEEGGRPCSTRWEVIERLDGPVPRTRVKLEPLTGRSHQLRLHMKAIGHPILGDTLHAPAEVAATCSRLCLHAVMLRVSHPRWEETMEWTSICPF